ncbi:hypothetical protein [Myroides odoratus]|uniref:hypothetical protein n=1 Tax=Myroides odoratus TaxID=256 RepID=UPI0039AF5210
MACGEIGLQLDDFYTLTLRQFTNICQGYFKKRKFQQNETLLGIRKIMYASLLPYQKQGFKEQDLFLLDFEQEIDPLIDLEEEIKEVEEQKAYWDKVDKQRESNKE